MGLPAHVGLSVAYALCDEWMWRRDVLAALGVEDPGRLDSILEEPDAGSRLADEDRRALVVEAAGAVGGEVVS